MHTYSRPFYEYINKGAIDSAEAILPLVKRHFPVTSVVDFGCGHGAWLAVWKRLGVPRTVGVDGDYVETDALLIDAEGFEARDLTKPVRLGQRFDLVQSLEVAAVAAL